MVHLGLKREFKKLDSEGLFLRKHLLCLQWTEGKVIIRLGETSTQKGVHRKAGKELYGRKARAPWVQGVFAKRPRQGRVVGWEAGRGKEKPTNTQQSESEKEPGRKNILLDKGKKVRMKQGTNKVNTTLS